MAALATRGLAAAQLDVALLERRKYSLTSAGLTFAAADGDVFIPADGSVRGWLRRLAPPQWRRDAAASSHEGAVRASWVALVIGIARSCRISWLSDIERLFLAENKLVQQAAAASLEIATPVTAVVASREQIPPALGERFVAKPLGPGQFDDPQGRGQAVFTRELTRDARELDTLGGAPFLLQQLLEADRHLRVVTVADRFWVCALEAQGLPLDWRRRDSAHDAFLPSDNHGEVGERIATNVCLKALARRPRQSSPRVGPPVSTGTTTLSPPIAELIHLQPYPDALLDDAREADPAARYLEREGIELAFIVAIQHLPPRQRAVLILREVLGWSAAECADLLDISVPTVTSALQRARVRIAKLGPEAMTPKPLSDDVERLLLRRYVDAWHRADIPALVALLREDAVMTMPPSPTWFLGRDAIGAFFASSPADGQSIDRMRLLETRANGRPTLAAYRADSAGVHRPYGLMVLTIDGDSISEITGFPEQGLFAAFGLPAAL